MKSSLFVSVVSWLDNRMEPVGPFARQLAQVLNAHYDNYEIVLVDDGAEASISLSLAALVREIRGLRVIRLSRRFGPDIALTAGLESAIGDFVITLDPRTDPPELIPQFIKRAQLRQGVVCGTNALWHRAPLWRRAGANIFHGLGRRLLGLELPRHVTHFRALSRQAVNALTNMRDKSRPFLSMVAHIGFPLDLLEYEPLGGERTASKATLGDELRTALQLTVSSSVRPLRLASVLGLLGSGLNVLYALYIILIALFKEHVAEGWVTLSMQQAGMFFLISLILAVIAEYLGQALMESRPRPLYYVQDELSASTVVPMEHRRNVVNDSL